MADSNCPRKPVEVQRAQVDELFKNLRGGEELEEMELRAPIFRVAYCFSDRVFLEALAFLVEREQEIDIGDYWSTLWQCIPNPITVLVSPRDPERVL
jgi:SWI/SNF-related matrix-associated actin-dependent regulator of chromatin subfamily A3